MSYEILYNAFTIQKENKYIPFVVIGSNNCTECNFSGRERRERKLNMPSYFFKDYQKTFNSIADLKNSFLFEKIQEELRTGSLQGKYKTANSIYNGFAKKIINYKDLNMIPEPTSLYYFTGTEEEKKQIELLRQSVKFMEFQTQEEINTVTQTMLNILPDELKARLVKEYSYLFNYRYNSNEYMINRAIKNITVPKIKKSYDTAELKQKLENAYIVDNNMPEEQFISEVLNRFENKRVVIYSNYSSFCIGRIKKVNNNIAFFRNGKKQYYNILTQKGSGYGAIELNKIALL